MNPLEVVSQVVGSLLQLLPWDVAWTDAGTDRRLVSQGRVRCGLRAVEGRVLNIGTEWSAGTCEISPGHLHFIPRIGILGTREIEVLSARLTDNRWAAQTNLFPSTPTTVVISTDAGELLWAIPEHVATRVAALLYPAPRR